MKRALTAVLVTVLAASAQASPIKWELVDVNMFNSPSLPPLAVTGSFVFDADTLAVTDVQISTLDGVTITCPSGNCGDGFIGGGAISGSDYTLGNAFVADEVSFFTQVPLGGTPLVFLNLLDPMTNLGGSISLATGLSVEFICNPGDDNCTNTFDVATVPFRSNIAGGSIRSVPSPGTLGILAAGLLILGAIRRKQAS